MTIPLSNGTLTLSEEEARELYEKLRGKFGAIDLPPWDETQLVPVPPRPKSRGYPGVCGMTRGIWEKYYATRSTASSRC